MSELIPTPAPKPAARKSAVKTIPKPRAPRTVDPAVAAINDTRKLALRALHSARASAKILATIIEKRLPKLTPLDKERLADHLAQMVTPALPLADETTLALPHPDGGMPLPGAGPATDKEFGG